MCETITYHSDQHRTHFTVHEHTLIFHLQETSTGENIVYLFYIDLAFIEELLGCRISYCIVRNCINQHRILGMGFWKGRFYLGHLTNVFHREESQVEEGKLGLAHSNFVNAFLSDTLVFSLLFKFSISIFESVLMIYPGWGRIFCYGYMWYIQ